MQLFEQLESEVRGYCRAWPVIFKSAKNARQTTEDGREFIDFFAGAGVLNFGHNDERMKKAMIAYLEADGVAHSLDMYTTAKRTFLEKFDSTILKPRGMNYKMQFTGPTGANAVEAALKLARKVTGRRNVIAFTNGFHGMTLGSLACTGNGYHRAAAGVTLCNVQRAMYDGYLGDGINTLDVLRKQLHDASSGYEAPAAFIVEPIQAEGGVNIASKEWLQGLQELARELGSLLILDDIQCGCGRTGKYFSFEDMGLDPDIINLAKGIGGYGIPMAMNLIKPDRDAWSPGEHTGTFRGQDLSFVAGTEALTYFDDPSFLDGVQKKGEHITKRLETIIADTKLEITLRGKGMIKGLDFGKGEIAGAVSKAAFERDLIIGTCGPGNRVLKVMSPLTIPEDDLDLGLDKLADAIKATEGN